MPPRHLYTLLCDYAFVDADGKHSYMGVFQNIQLSTPAPGSIARFFIAVSVLAEEKTEIELVFVSADETWESLAVKGPVPSAPAGSKPAEVQGVIVVAGAENFEFPAAGQYQLRVKANGQVLHDYPFGVREQGKRK